MTRIAKINRQTAETQIELELNLDGTGKSNIETGVGFFDHMLELFARHGSFDLTVKAVGDLHVDQHHTAEDTGICLGQAIAQALGDKAGIRRYGHFTLQPVATKHLQSISLSVDLEPIKSTRQHPLAYRGRDRRCRRPPAQIRT